MQNPLLVSSTLYNSSPKRFKVALRGWSRFWCSLTQSDFTGFLTWTPLADRISNSLLSDLVCLVYSRALSFIVEIWPLFSFPINRWFLSDVAWPFHSFSSYIYLNGESHLVGGAKNWWRNEPDLKREYNFILFKKLLKTKPLISNSQRYSNEYLWDDALITLHSRREDFSTNSILSDFHKIIQVRKVNFWFSRKAVDSWANTTSFRRFLPVTDSVLGKNSTGNIFSGPSKM